MIDNGTAKHPIQQHPDYWCEMFLRWAYAAFKGLTEVDAKDLVQDVYLTLHTEIVHGKDVPIEPAAIWAWFLIRARRYRSTEFERYVRRRRSLSADAAARLIARECSAPDHAVRQAEAVLRQHGTEEELETFDALRGCSGSCERAANRLQISTRTLYTRRQKLRATLKQFGL